MFLCEEDADSVIRTVKRGMVVVEWQGYIAPGPNRWCGPGTDVLRPQVAWLIGFDATPPMNNLIATYLAFQEALLFLLLYLLL